MTEIEFLNIMRLCEAKGRTRGRHRHGVSNQFEGNEPRKRKEICDNDDVREIRGHWYYRPVVARAITVDLTNGHLSPSDLFHPSCFSLFHYLKKPMEWGYNNDAMTYMASPPVKTIPDNKDTFSFCHRRCVESGVSRRKNEMAKGIPLYSVIVCRTHQWGKGPIPYHRSYPIHMKGGKSDKGWIVFLPGLLSTSEESNSSAHCWVA